MVLVVRQMPDTDVSVTLGQPTLGVHLTDDSGQMVELHLRRESWISITDWMDRGEIHIGDMRIAEDARSAEQQLRRRAQRTNFVVGVVNVLLIVVVVAAVYIFGR